VIEALFTVLLERFISNKSTVDRIVLAQFVMTMVVAGLSLIFGWVAAYSSLLGGMVTVLPGFIAARRLRNSLLIKQSELLGGISTLVVRGELVKFALSVMLFIAIFILVTRLSAAFFFTTFAGTQLIYLVLPVVEANRLRNRFRNDGNK
jgi:ATP synthase protein I